MLLGKSYQFAPSVLVQQYCSFAKASTCTAVDGNILETNSPELTVSHALMTFPFFLKQGEHAELSLYARVISGQGSISAGRNAVAAEPFTYVDGITLDYNNAEQRDWKPYKMVITGSVNKPYASISLGVPLEYVGKAQFKDIVFTIFSKNADKKVMCVIKIVNGVASVMKWINSNANTGVDKVVTTTSTIDISYTDLGSWYMPIVHASVDSSRLGWMAQCYSPKKDSCSLKIVDAAGNLVNPKNIVGATYIHFTAETV